MWAWDRQEERIEVGEGREGKKGLRGREKVPKKGEATGEDKEDGAVGGRAREQGEG